MKKALPYLLAEVLISLILALVMNRGFNNGYLTMVGLINLILGILGLILGVIFSIAREETISKGLLISSALLLLMGLLTCSVFPMKFN
jgi:hypothetical protein